MSRIHVPLVLSHSPSSISPEKVLRLLRQFRPAEFGHARLCMRVLPFLLALCFVAFSCKETPPEANTGHLILEVEDVSCTEVWLHVNFVKVIGPEEIVLTRDGVTIASATVYGPDTTLFDEGLQASRSYVYGVSTRLANFSATVQAKTLDPTSDNFSWAIDTLGDGASSALYDVAIINDTLAYAVGRIYLWDSTAHEFDPNAYNLLKWNSRNWGLLRIWFQTICGSTNLSSYPISSLQLFTATDLWVVGAGNQIVRWNGTSQTNAVCLPFDFGVVKLWGGSRNSVYAVGYGGNIVHFDGTSWQKLASGTTVDIHDVWGAVDSSTGKAFILAPACYRATPGDLEILHITDQNTVDTLRWGTGRQPHSVWFRSARKIYVCGDGVFSRSQSGLWREETDVSLIYTERIRGVALNDIFVVGDFGLVAHWNGLKWHVYPEVAAADIYNSVAYNGRMMVAVGFLGARAVALRMYR